MDSTPPFRLRTTIMVVSMIALPLVAVCGFRLPKWGEAKSEAAKPAKLAAKTATQPPRTATPAPSDPGTSAEGGLAAAETTSTGDSNNQNYPVVQAANTDVRAVSGPVVPTGAIVPARMYPLPSPAHEADLTTADDPASAPARVDEHPGGDRFSAIQQRLRALGALHYVLETYGAEGDKYRFQCRMSAGHHPNYSRHFEATDGDVLCTMQTVLDEVEAWKAGRVP